MKKKSAGKKPDSAWFTPGRARNAIAVAKVIGPAVLPVVAPYVAKSAAALRDRLDRRRAYKLGVEVDQLPQFSGRGGALYARISGAATALADLRDRPGATAQDQSFAEDNEQVLGQLAAAVRAAERMPTPRRKAAHRAVAAELDQLEQRLLGRLGV